jgi:CheY-like chemotaxis protein
MASATVLCIDDDVTGLNVRKLLLESRGYQVLTADSGPAGLRLLQEHTVDLVLLDYYMPEMHGGLVAAEIKRLRPSLPIIMLSAYFWLPEEALATCDGFVTKSDPPAKLFEKIQQYVPIR